MKSQTCEEPSEGDSRWKGQYVQWSLYENQYSMFGELKEGQRKVRRGEQWMRLMR